MARPPEPKPTGNRVTIKTTLTSSFVDNYWTNIPDMTETAWLRYMSPAQRYEVVLEHMIARIQADQRALNEPG
jgi:hypothetical protein